MRILYNKPIVLKQPVHKVLETSLSTQDARKAVEDYKRMKADTSHYYVDWLAMDQLGNQLFTLKRYEDARIIFENNVTEFSGRDIAFVSLAKTYDVLNRKKDAIASYQKAIAINPNNEEAKNRLKTLLIRE